MKKSFSGLCSAYRYLIGGNINGRCPIKYCRLYLTRIAILLKCITHFHALPLNRSVFLFLIMIAGCKTGPPLRVNEQEKTKEQITPFLVTPFEGITVYLKTHEVHICATVCDPPEPLEQIACTPKTREHESLLVIKNKPSEIHAALLLAGFIPGHPGRWREEDERILFVPPTGSELDLFILHAEESGKQRWESIRSWIHDPTRKNIFSNALWRFGGSMFRKNPEWMGPGEHYVADMTGSIIGLATFGDETIGFAEEISDQEAVRPTEWYADHSVMPAPGSEIVLIITSAGAKPDLLSSQD